MTKIEFYKSDTEIFYPASAYIRCNTTYRKVIYGERIKIMSIIIDEYRNERKSLGYDFQLFSDWEVEKDNLEDILKYYRKITINQWNNIVDLCNRKIGSFYELK